MKKTLLIGILLSATHAHSQVGINNTAPKATLDVTNRTADGSKPEGIIAPRLSGNQIKAADAQYSNDQKGTLVYVTAAVSSPTVGSKTANITTEGYYYFDGNFWQKLSIGTFPVDADMTNDAWLNDPTSSMVKLSTKADGTTRTAGTEFVAKDNGNVGIGTNNPSGALDVSSITDGFLMPRMTTAQRNAISSPAKATLVFDTTLNQYYYFSGLQWDPLVPVTASSKIFQIVRKNTNQTIPAADVAGDITFNSSSGQGDGVIIDGSTISLPAGKTFLLTGYLAIGKNSNSTQSWASYEIVDSTSNNSSVCTVASRGYSEPSTEVSNDSQGGPALCMINTGTSIKKIKLRITNKRTDANIVTTSIEDPYAETAVLIQEL